MAIDKDRPTIIIACPAGSNDQLPEKLKPMLLGIEEEQIPYQFTDIDKPTAVERAYDASVISRLSVGIGFDDDQVIVHYKNLKPDSPLFKVAETGYDAIRKVGANAARLVKGVPFKK
ncbi:MULTISPECIES: glycerol dehydratase reactivase beta/small subunit family protein [Lactobacillaceae]|jgi:hypothetical protein|uniref:Pduh protein n=1 Tax=Secundilactobacillus similis DSM 23365 = JCM 2765 TaxID=1423804 RepID=A0A0R2EGZ3_9LACO|nr:MULTISPECIES: glycerol dehydratase reactivase beta/small subunit family protein [Lactobacillaceae]KRN15550.1 pduh protein [Secundilactobacillus similis DSM 23365 = JCM 2765]